MRWAATLGLLVVVGLPACKPESEDIVVTINTSDWSRYRLGYHSFQALLDLTPGRPVANVDGEEIRVLRGTAAPVREVIAAQEDFGRDINAVRVNDWDVVVATQNNGLVESDFTLLVIGARRIGPDVVVTRKTVPREKNANVTDPALWAWHQDTRPHLLSDRPDLEGYCHGGVVFETRRPPVRASFSTTLGVLGPRNPEARRTPRSDVRLSLQSLHYPPEGDEDARALAPVNDVPALPGVGVAREELRLDGREVGFATTTFDLDERGTPAHDAAVFGAGQGPDDPGILTMKFMDESLDGVEGRDQALAIFGSLRLGWREVSGG